MTSYTVTCFSSPADGIPCGSIILQCGGCKGPKVPDVCIAAVARWDLSSCSSSAAARQQLTSGYRLQYLFNAPEGFARLVLEHKLRPSQHLRAAFLTQLQPHAAVSFLTTLSFICHYNTY